MLKCTTKPPTRGHDYSPHKARPTTLRRPHHLQVGQETCVTETQVPALFSHVGLQPPCCCPLRFPQPHTCFCYSCLWAFGGSPCGGLCLYPTKQQLGHLLFDSDVGPSPKAHMLSFKLSCDHGTKRAGDSCLYLGHGHMIHTSPTIIWSLENQRHAILQLTAQHRTGTASMLVSSSSPQNTQDWVAGATKAQFLTVLTAKVQV